MSSPYVFPPDSKELSIRERIFNDLQIFIESKDFTHCYSITLTLTPAEVHTLRKEGADITGYFRYLLKEYDISGTHVIEFTKKGVQHLHGIFYKMDYGKNLVKHGVKRRKNFEVYYTSKVINGNHKIKTLSSISQYNGWVGYMCKNQVPTTVVHYIQNYFADKE